MDTIVSTDFGTLSPSNSMKEVCAEEGVYKAASTATRIILVGDLSDVLKTEIQKYAIGTIGDLT